MPECCYADTNNLVMGSSHRLAQQCGNLSWFSSTMQSAVYAAHQQLRHSYGLTHTPCVFAHCLRLVIAATCLPSSPRYITRLAQCHSGDDLTSIIATDRLCSCDRRVSASIITFSQADMNDTCDCVLHEIPPRACCLQTLKGNNVAYGHITVQCIDTCG